MEEKNTELPHIETILNSLKTRCGSNEVKTIAKQLNLLQKKMHTSHEKAKKVKEVFIFTISEGYVAI